mmetsp:Transcript_5359/g.7534  ORF Transcript_5359/g.7534 Transcript_5359/m.7534 type:complete len:733 (-) Transcript_5359:7-2205(-)
MALPKIELDSEERWYDRLEKEKMKNGTTSIDIKVAENLWLTEISAWETEKKKHENGDDRYIQQIIKSGTLSDKVAAMTLMVQESPVHRFATLENLLAMSKSGKHAAKMAIDSLKELFSTSLLPPDRKVEMYTSQSNEIAAILSYFEQRIKKIYNDFIDAVEASTKHQAVEIRKFGIETAATLLSARPEQEARLLAIVVNKLGDRDGQAQAVAHACLKRLLAKHRAMTKIVAREVQALAARPNIDESSQYAALGFLSQIYLDKEHLGSVADSLIDMYIRLFRTTIQSSFSDGKKKKDKTQPLRTKLLALLLTGLKRALPYCSQDAKTIISKNDQMDALFRLSHTGTLPSRVQSLYIIQKLIQNDQKLEARFFRSLYELLLAPELRRTNKISLALNLCFTALSRDTDAGRAAACLKRLVHATAHASPACCAAAVYLAANLRRRNQRLNNALENLPDLSVSNQQVNVLDDTLLKRDPRYVDSLDKRPWELQTLAHHYHPSVSIFCRNFLLRDAALPKYKGDPLEDFALANFFDRFAYRNPKNEKRSHHAKPKSRLSMNSALFDSYDFYAEYLEQAKKSIPLEKEKEKHITHKVDDQDEEQDEHAFINDISAGHEDIMDSEDDEEIDMDDLVTPLGDDDDNSTDDDQSPKKKRKSTLSFHSTNKKFKSSPFVDADAYMAELEQKQQKQQQKDEARHQRRAAREAQDTTAHNKEKELISSPNKRKSHDESNKIKKKP